MKEMRMVGVVSKRLRWSKTGEEFTIAMANGSDHRSSLQRQQVPVLEGE